MKSHRFVFAKCAVELLGKAGGGSGVGGVGLVADAKRRETKKKRKKT